MILKNGLVNDGAYTSKAFWQGLHMGWRKAKDEYGKNIDLSPLAETWECSGHPDGPSYVMSGEYKGKSLAEITEENPEWLGTKCNPENGFPILIKFIDAAKDLSVQVHPSDEYAKEYENGQNGKTEMWYVLEAEPDARLVWGFEHKVTRRQLKENIDQGGLSKDLHYVLH